MSNAEEIRDNLDTAVATELGIPIEEARELVGAALGTLAPPAFEDTPYEVIRKTPKPPKNMAWSLTLSWYRDHAHEVWQARPSSTLSGWTWYVLKSYQKDRTADFARAFCLVDGFESELGDVYWSEIIQSAVRVR